LAIGSQAAVTIVDVSHPSAPVWIACLEEDKKNLFGLVGGSALAMAGHRLVDCYDTLVLFDLIDPSHPRRLGVAEQGVGGVNSLLAPDAVAFTGTNVVVLDWDTSSLTILGFSPAPAGLVSQGWVGIGVETPMAPLHVVGNVLVEQASCFNVLADHSSFGKDNIVTGTDAFAAGRMNTAGGEDSVAMGFDAQAVGRTSIALGTQVSATGYAAVALGGDATASGNAAVAMGSSTTASGFASVAMGDQTHANGEACLAMGTQTTASGTNTLSVGENAYADGFDSVALGMGATASGAAAFAMGDHTEAFGSNSMAMGKGAVAYHDHTFVWADDSYPYFNGVVFPFTSTGTNQFLIHASGGVGINTAYPNGAALNVNGAVVATAFVGSQELTLDTTNYQPLVLRVNGTRALRIEGSKDNSQHQGVVNLVGGSPINLVDPNVMGATIAGGGAANWMGDTGSNRVSANFGAIGGGLGNTIDTNADFACISGGELCTIHQGASNAAIGGGWDNLVETNALYATIAGGFGNWIWPNSSSATIAGGEDNQVLSGSIGASVGGGVDNRIAGGARFGALSGGTSNLVSGAGAFLGGGGYDGTSIQGNTASGAGAVMGGGTANLASGSRSAVVGGHNNAATNWYATVPGGAWNTAGGQGSFAAGRAARALDDGSFVWNCDWMNALASTGANQFLARASGGFSFYTGASGGATLAAGSGSWTSMSDRNAKDNFAPVDPRAVLEKVTELPLSIWNYKAQDPAIRHLGPMAQDFKAAFGLGETDTGITGVDADGVALAAIQGLNQKLESQQEQLRAKDARIQTLEQRIERLESLLNKTAEPSTGGNQ